MSATSRPPSSRLGLRIEQAKWELALPDGARRLIASGDFDGRDHESLVRWLGSDPDLSRRLLSWCNTPLYNLSRPFESFEQAAIVMDSRDLARLALLAWVRQMFLPELQFDIYSREVLWGHSIAVGAVASMISRTCGHGEPSLVFVAGALHDIGLAASERLDRESFERVISEVDELSPTREIERDLLGWDHTELGSAILAQWGMPEAVQVAAAMHHDADQALGQPHWETVSCVAIANFLCSRSGWASVGSNHVAAPSDRVFGSLEIDAELLTVLWQQLYPALNSVTELR